MADQFRTCFPDVNLQTDRLITHENGSYTNGGAYSFLHLLIHSSRNITIGKQPCIAPNISRSTSTADFRQNSPFSTATSSTKTRKPTAQTYIEENYKGRISVEELSANLNIGRRNFDRRFIKATGLTPIDYLQRVRIEAAKRAFEPPARPSTKPCTTSATATPKPSAPSSAASPASRLQTKYNKEGTYLVHTFHARANVAILAPCHPDPEHRRRIQHKTLTILVSQQDGSHP
ncbi:MAG: AraC family transcriptional regulator [Bacteroidia bacterium]